MNLKLIIISGAVTLLNSCFQGEQGPQGIVGQKGDDGKNYEEHDSTLINSNNKFKITATKEWIKSGIRVNFGDKILIKASTNIPESAGNGSLSYLLVNEQII